MRKEQNDKTDIQDVNTIKAWIYYYKYIIILTVLLYSKEIIEISYF